MGLYEDLAQWRHCWIILYSHVLFSLHVFSSILIPETRRQTLHGLRDRKDRDGIKHFRLRQAKCFCAMTSLLQWACFFPFLFTSYQWQPNGFPVQGDSPTLHCNSAWRVHQRQEENIVKLQETTAKSFDHVVPFSVHAWMKKLSY